MTGIILAGGKNSRMGRDKSFLLFSGRPMIEILIDRLSPLFDELMIVTNSPSRYKKYGLRMEGDIFRDKGPLAGIHAGLTYSGETYNFFCACDMPFLSRDLIRYMAGMSGGYDAAIPRYKERLEPLCGVYSRTCINPIETALSKNNLKIADFIRDIKVRVITEKEIDGFDSSGLLFANINTPQDMITLNNRDLYHGH